MISRSQTILRLFILRFLRRIAHVCFGLIMTAIPTMLIFKRTVAHSWSPAPMQLLAFTVSILVFVVYMAVMIVRDEDSWID